MDLNKFLLFIFTIFFAKVSYSQLPELLTKSDIKNIRYISKDGSITYYQRRSGNLLLSTNYKVEEVLNSSLGSQYQIYSSEHQKNLIIELDNNFHTFYSIRHLKDLYSLKAGSKGATPIGKGVSPQLHLEDTWVSFFDPFQKKIFFKNIKSKALSFSIKIKNTLNPFFIPHAVMLNEYSILYTDINNKGINGILKFDRNTKKISPLFKSSHHSQRLELCLASHDLFIGEFGINKNRSGSTIAKISLLNFNIDRAEIIYQSNNNDLGQLKCNYQKESLYFIKNISLENGRIQSDVFSLNYKKKIKKRVSHLKYVSQLIVMGKRLLIPHRGKFYVLSGQIDSTKSDTLKEAGGKSP